MLSKATCLCIPCETSDFGDPSRSPFVPLCFPLFPSLPLCSSRCAQGTPHGLLRGVSSRHPRTYPEITRAAHAAFLENRFKNRQVARRHQPSDSQQPAASSQHRGAKPRSLFLPPSVEANTGTDQIPKGNFIQRSAWPSGLRGAIESPASAKDAGRFE